MTSASASLTFLSAVLSHMGPLKGHQPWGALPPPSSAAASQQARAEGTVVKACAPQRPNLNYA